MCAQTVSTRPLLGGEGPGDDRGGRNGPAGLILAGPLFGDQVNQYSNSAVQKRKDTPFGRLQFALQAAIILHYTSIPPRVY